jgi:two-component SAPR family response regulator
MKRHQEAGHMCLHDHRCAFLEDAAKAPLICADPIATAERAGFERLIVSDDGTGSRFRGKSSASIVASGEFGMAEMPISIADIMRRIRERVEASVAAGFSGLLLIIDMSWLLRVPSGIAHHGEFEAALQELMVGPLPLRTICLYHLSKFPEEMTLDAMRTHPRILTEDGEFENPHFLPPQVFLSGDSAAKFQTWLNNLWPLQGVEDAHPPRRRLVRRGAAASSAVSPSGSGKPDIQPVRSRERWKIRCFGNLRIYRQDGSPVHWNVANGATIKTKTLFAYLLQCGAKGATAEELADLLWPQAQCTSQSLNRLYHTIHCLRMALSPDLKHSRVSPFVLGHDHHYRLSLPEGTWMDVPIFEQFCRRGEKLLKANQLEEALTCCVAAEKLHTGTLLSDIPAEYIQNIDRDWCWSRRYWLDEVYVKLLTQISSLHRHFGRMDDAIDYAEKALRIEPCFELAHQELMHIFNDLGRRDAIERQYRLCLGALKRQEDRAPSGSTRILFQRLIS